MRHSVCAFASVCALFGITLRCQQACSDLVCSSKRFKFEPFAFLIWWQVECEKYLIQDYGICLRCFLGLHLILQLLSMSLKVMVGFMFKQFWCHPHCPRRPQAQQSDGHRHSNPTCYLCCSRWSFALTFTISRPSSSSHVPLLFSSHGHGRIGSLACFRFYTLSTSPVLGLLRYCGWITYLASCQVLQCHLSGTWQHNKWQIWSSRHMWPLHWS